MNLNTKKIVIIMVIGIVILVGVSLFMLLRKTDNKSLKNNQNPPQEKSEASIFLSEGETVPSLIQIKTGEAINFINTTKQDLEVNVTGKENTVIKIPAGKNQLSPIFTMSGTYKFKEVKNSEMSGDIVVEDLNASSVSVSPSVSKTLPTSAPTVEIKNVSVVISSSGFSPNELTITKNTVIMFENKSGNDFAFSESSVKSILLKVIQKGMILPSPLLKEGSYILVNKNDNSQTLEINVK